MVLWLSIQLWFSLLLLKKKNLMDMRSIMKAKIKKILKVQVMDQMQVMEMNQITVMSDKKHTEDHTSKNKGSDISIVSLKSNNNRTEDRTSKDKEIDIIMNSPPVSPPHTTSGILRGNALGNHPNATDFHSAAESTTIGLAKGTVMVPGVTSFTLKHNLMATIGPVLKKLKDRAEHFFTADHCLYVYESKAWNILGNFESAVKDNDEVDWLKINGEFILPILSSGFQPNAPLSLDIETYSIQSKFLETFLRALHLDFKSHTRAWYENYSNFDKIADFPAMQSWLAEDEDSPTDLDLWGFERDYYTFLDLKRWLKKKKEKRKGKGKGKGKGKEEKEGKDKEKSSSKKHNWMVTFETYLCKFILSNFGSNITLSATLVILFSMIDNVDLLSLHARQQNAKLTGEKNVDATAWIRLLARAIQEKIGMDSDDLFDNYEINEHTT
ncbi:hypothetical protein BDQ17DRAFT_1327140 [Cyathus striatus]|nr:hypothetical protein BDQ17DRAFT_1327140 [Cyathus striatus]